MRQKKKKRWRKKQGILTRDMLEYLFFRFLIGHWWNKKQNFVMIKTTYSSRYSFVACNSRYVKYSLEEEKEICWCCEETHLAPPNYISIKMSIIPSKQALNCCSMVHKRGEKWKERIRLWNELSVWRQCFFSLFFCDTFFNQCSSRIHPRLTGNSDKDCMSKRKIFFGWIYSEELSSPLLLPFHVETLQDEMPDSSRKEFFGKK